MKVEVKKKEQKNEYPCLKIYKDNTMLILFTGEGKGMVLLDSGGDWKVGDYLSDWEEDSFKPFNGEITLSND